MARAVTVGPVAPGLARIDWSCSSSQRRTTLSRLLGASPLIVYRGGGKSGSGGPAVCARATPPKLAMSTAATTTAESPRLDRTRMHPPRTGRDPRHGPAPYRIGTTGQIRTEQTQGASGPGGSALAATGRGEPLAGAVGGDPALADQLGQVGPDRQLGRRVQGGVDGGVDPGHDLGRGAVAGGKGGQHLGLAVEAVGQVALDPGDGVGDQRAVARVEPLGPEVRQQL